ncbi:putative disease resistance protein [Quercus suber]|uniref:Disease resistance protein n=1 Tax=Quercus suber TaxID=58331 RepID=A0AAW0LK40_QUESU
MNFRDKIEEKIFDWVLVALLAPLGFVLAALGYSLRYLICYKSNVDNLKTQVEELLGARDRLKHDVDTARSNLMKIEDDVKRQLTESDDIIAVAEKILEFDNMGRYPNMMSRFQVSRRAEKAAWEAENLKDEIIEILKFNRVGYRESTRVGGTAISNRGYESFESRRLILTDVLEALKNPNITRIGLYGMGGIGKTMLVKEVLKQAERYQLFDKYLFVVVSNPPDLKKIQREIAEKLGLKLEGEITESVLADRLCERLKQENRVLMVLDDIWKYLDLEALGIFFGDDQNGCKLLLTSRLQNILRDFMDAQTQFPVGVLSDDEAISLFEKIVGNLAKTGEFKSNMHQIVKECAGLPIAITTVANALKNKKNIYVWKDALNKLKMSCPIKIEGMDEVYRSIKLSYDFLESDAKSLLSLCSLHREDNNIEVEDLLKYGVGLDLEDAVAISLPYINDDLELPNQFECSKLKLLLLFRQKVGFRIPDSFFEGLKDLKVLKLSRSWSGVLPSSLSSLENLQTLCLDGEVQNAIIIGELKNLKALSLSLSDTERLPQEIGQLTHLQLLDLRGCSRLQFIPPNVLSNLKRLEELYLPDDVEWEVEVQSTEKINAMVSELDHLSHLTKLHIRIENAKILPNAMVFERLESYRIAIGSASLRGETLETSRILKLKISFQSDNGYKVLFRKCENLILDEMKGVKNNLYELDSEGFQSLKHLTVQHNDEIQYICMSMGVLDSVFPSLESITLRNVNNLERICYTQLSTKTFCNLRVVKVSKCCKLESVFSSSMVGSFIHLQEMNIKDCEIMSAIVAIEREEEIEVNSDDNIMFENLHSLKLRKLFKLKGFLSVVDSLVLFNGKDKFPNLEELYLDEGDAMNETCGGPSEEFCCNWLKQLTLYGNGEIPNVEAPIARAGVSDFRRLKNIVPFSSTSFHYLMQLYVSRSDVLISLLTPSTARTLVQLQLIRIENCKRITEIVANEGSEAEAGDEIAFNNLRLLSLNCLPSLTAFHLGNRTIKFPSLDEVFVFDCPKLKIFCSGVLSTPKLTGGWMEEKRILKEEGDGDVDLLNARIKEYWEAKLETCDQKLAEKVVFPILKNLEIEGTDCMNMIWPDQLISDFSGKL